MVVIGSWSPASTPSASYRRYDEGHRQKPSTSASEVTRAKPMLWSTLRAVMPHRNAGYQALAKGQLYELLVLQRGWSVSRFARFISDFMIAALLPPAADGPNA
jgi:hypothetical protein